MEALQKITRWLSGGGLTVMVERETAPVRGRGREGGEAWWSSETHVDLELMFVGRLPRMEDTEDGRWRAEETGYGQGWVSGLQGRGMGWKWRLIRLYVVCGARVCVWFLLSSPWETSATTREAQKRQSPPSSFRIPVTRLVSLPSLTYHRTARLG